MARKGTYVKLELDIDALREALDDELDDAIFHGGLVVADVVRAKAPGEHIRDSVYVSTRKRTTYRRGEGYRNEEKPRKKGETIIAAAYFTAKFFEFGTRAHEIRPSNARALRLPDGFVARVSHPVMAARPFLRPALDEAGDKAAQVAADHLRQRMEAR